MYNDTCINWSCSKAETLLGRTDTFDLFCFLYASLSRISKAETVKRTLLQTDNSFSPQIKKATCFTHTQRTILGIPRNRELNWTFLSIFLKRKIFYTLKQQWFFLISFYSFEGIQYFWVELCIFFYKSPSATTQLVSLKVISDKDHWTILHPSMNYCLHYSDLHWVLVKCQWPADKCTKNFGDRFHCRHVYIR